MSCRYAMLRRIARTICLGRRGQIGCPAAPMLASVLLLLTSCHDITAGEGHKAAKERVREAKVASVAKVVGVSKLKTKYEVR